jgi:hypothetical protein
MLDTVFVYVDTSIEYSSPIQKTGSWNCLLYVPSKLKAKPHPHCRLHLIHIISYISSTLKARSHPNYRLRLIDTIGIQTTDYISSTM